MMSTTGAPRKIAIVVDNPRRDLRGLVLLAHHLARRGVAAYVVPMYQQGYDIPLIAPDLVLANYARESNRPLLETYRQSGYKVAVMDTEGGILSSEGHDAPDNWAGSLRTSGLAALIDYYAFWGEEVHRAFVSHSGISPERMWVTGCPRYDLCSEPWRAMLRHPSSNFILVNTNFSAINPRYTRSAGSERAIFKSLGWADDYIERIFADLQAVFPRYLETIERAAKTFPNRTFLLRPHPFENETFYRERFATVENVVIDGAGDVLNVIAQADGILHLNCGTAVDAVLSGKVPVSMEFLNTETMRSHAPLPTQVSLGAASFDELCRYIEDLPARTPYRLADGQAVTEPWFHFSDGRAAERLADRLLTALQQDNPAPRLNPTAALAGSRRDATAGQRALGLASFLGGSSLAHRLRQKIQPSRTGKNFLPEEVQALLKGYAACAAQPQAIARHARNPYTSLPLSSIEVVPA